MNNPTNELIEKVAEAAFNAQHEEQWNSEPDGLVKTMWRDSAKAILAVIPDCGEWRPIESAPKDGEVFDIWISWKGGGDRFANVFWMDNPLIDDEKMGAGLCFGKGWRLQSRLTATHWMPLPLPPTETKNEE